jgi:hypothetical protein
VLSEISLTYLSSSVVYVGARSKGRRPSTVY